MSNDRHQTIDNGTMGNLFRRVTLATLGLDSLDGISEQSFDVIDKADSFAARLMNGVSYVMPKIDSEKMGAKATLLTDHLMESMTGLNGPKSATDLGEWQYWLDAVLLMLFDEEDDEESSEDIRHSRTTPRKSTQAEIKKRVTTLQNSGFRPSMIQAMSSKSKKELAATLASTHHIDGINTIEKTLKKILDDTVKSKQNTPTKDVFSQDSSRYDVASMERIFTQNARQTLESHIVNKAQAIATSLPADEHIQELVGQWTNSVQSLAQHTDMSAVRDMMTILDRLEKAGAVTKSQASSLRNAGNTYARRILSDEIAHDASAIAGRVEQMLKASGSARLISQKAMTFSSQNDTHQTHGSFSQIFSRLNDTLNDFTNAVSNRVMKDGESAATVRWMRAADRFTRMQGVSDETDRVLLKDMLESASELRNAGIVPQRLLDTIKEASNTPALSRVSMQDMIHSPRILGGLARRMEHSMNALVKELAVTGIAGKGVDTFIADINQLIATGHNNTSSASVIESICVRLDEFAELAASSVITNGYDELTNQETGRFVAQHDDVSDSEHPQNASSHIDNVRQIQDAKHFQEIRQIQDAKHFQEIRQIQNALVEANKQALTLAKQTMSRHIAELNQKEQEHFKQFENASTFAELHNAQNALSSIVSSQVRSEIAKTVEAVENSQKHLDNIQRQIELIEKTKTLVAGLRTAALKHADPNTLALSLNTQSSLPSVVMDDMRIDSSYLKALSGTLASFGKVKNSFAPSAHSFFAQQADARLDKMLALIKPNTGATPLTIHANDAKSINNAINSNTIGSNSFIDNVKGINRYMDTSIDDVVLGYDDIIEPSHEWIRETEHYPSQNSNGDLGAVFGNRKAAEHFISEIAGGNVGEVKSLVASLNKLIATGENASSLSTLSSYSMTNQGDQIKVALNIQQNPSQDFMLRQNIGQSYQPVALRGLQSTSKTASLDISVPDHSVSGIQEFVPVSAGIHSKASPIGSHAESDIFARFGIHAARIDAYDEQASMEKISMDKASMNHQDMGTSDTTDQVKDKQSFQKLDIPFLKSDMLFQKWNTSDSNKVKLNIGGMDFVMTPDAFVQMVARPMMSTAASMPSMMDANNALFAGYASLLDENTNRRTLNSLRHAYVETLAQSGKSSAHAEIGFNTKNFADMLGATSEQPAAFIHQADRSKSETTPSSAEQLGNELAAHSDRVAALELSEGTNYTWVANPSQDHASDDNSFRRTVSSQEEANRQILGRIDNMLDYVENLSERNVGVFSTDDTIRVLLETLPAEGQLGNKGLPKWRQKDTKATRMSEARELREALAKIGASPIQGTQRYANKQYVSPNLFPAQASNAAPLFSGGDEGVTTPGASANASGAGESQFTSSSIQEEDLQFIAEEVFYKISESLNEEYQRRRSE